jgi:hypothetical protein
VQSGGQVGQETSLDAFYIDRKPRFPQAGAQFDKGIIGFKTAGQMFFKGFQAQSCTSSGLLGSFRNKYIIVFTEDNKGTRSFLKCYQ